MLLIFQETETFMSFSRVFQRVVKSVQMFDFLRQPLVYITGASNILHWQSTVSLYECVGWEHLLVVWYQLVLFFAFTLLSGPLDWNCNGLIRYLLYGVFVLRVYLYLHILIYIWRSCLFCGFWSELKYARKRKFTFILLKWNPDLFLEN